MNYLNDPAQIGDVEAYALGTLPGTEAQKLTQQAAADPDLREEIDRTIDALAAVGLAPAPGLKGRVLDFLQQHMAAEAIDLKSPPDIHRLSDAFAWQKAVDGLEATVFEKDFKVRPLFESPEKELCIVWLNDQMLEDAHEAGDFRESFLILEGACECDFDGEIARFSAGDYFDVPPGTRHCIRNISEGLPFVKGLVQRRKAA